MVYTQVVKSLMLAALAHYVVSYFTLNVTLNLFTIQIWFNERNLHRASTLACCYSSSNEDEDVQLSTITSSSLTRPYLIPHPSIPLFYLPIYLVFLSTSMRFIPFNFPRSSLHTRSYSDPTIKLPRERFFSSTSSFIFLSLSFYPILQHLLSVSTHSYTIPPFPCN